MAFPSSAPTTFFIVNNSRFLILPDVRISNLSIARGEFNILGFQNKNLRVKLKEKTTRQRCRIIKRLRVHGFIRKITHSDKYHLTTLGRSVIVLGLKLKVLVIIPQLALQHK